MVDIKDNFTTIFAIALLSVGIFYLLKPSSSNFTNLEKPVEKKLGQKISVQKNSEQKKLVQKKPVSNNNVKIQENIANVNDNSLLYNPNTPVNLDADVPLNPGSMASPAAATPQSVTASAALNKQFASGQFKPLLLTPSSEVIPSSIDMANASIDGEYTLGVDQNIANPSGRKMQTSDDLRPSESNSGWFNPPYDRDSQMYIENGNLLASATAQAKIGIDTIGQSLRNASYDIRGSVPIPKLDIGPFNNSTIEYDYNVKSLY